LKTAKYKFKLFIGLLSLGAFILFAFNKSDRITVYLIGDSTMADKEVKAYPETGWGMPFHYYFDSTVTVDTAQRMEEAPGRLLKREDGNLFCKH